MLQYFTPPLITGTKFLSIYTEFDKLTLGYRINDYKPGNISVKHQRMRANLTSWDGLCHLVYIYEMAIYLSDRMK